MNKEIDKLIIRKEELDQRNEGALNMVSYDRWIADALEALLKTIAVKAQAAAAAAKP